MATPPREIDPKRKKMIEALAKKDQEAQAASRSAQEEALRVRADLLEAVRGAGLPLRTVAPMLGMSAQRLHVLLKPPEKRRRR